MPSRGRSRSRGSARLIVGNPSARPRFAPCTTSPRTPYGRPRSRVARSTSPARRRFRIRVELTISPSIWTGRTTSTAKPSGAARVRSVSTSPSARCPKWKSGPTTMRRTSPAVRRRSTNSSAESFANASSKRKTTTASVPAARSSLIRSRTSESADAGAPGASTWIGSGSRPGPSVRGKQWREAGSKGPASTTETPDPPHAGLTQSQERNRREDRDDEPEVVPLEVAPEEQEGKERERVAGKQRRDGRPLPEPEEPPRGDRRSHRDLDRREREVRLPIRDHAQRKQQR